MILGTFLTGCLEPEIQSNPLIGLDDSVFEKEQEYQAELNTIDQLTIAYVENTYALRTVNNKLDAICIAAKRCRTE